MQLYTRWCHMGSSITQVLLNRNVFLKNLSLERWPSGQEHSLLFQRTPVWVPSLSQVRCLTSTCNSSSPESYVLFWFSWALIQRDKHTDTSKNKCKKEIYLSSNTKRHQHQELVVFPFSLPMKHKKQSYQPL